LTFDRRLLLLAPLGLLGCVDLDAQLAEPMPQSAELETMEASVSVGTERSFPFVADDVVASITTANQREELVISGISADRSRTLAFVLDLETLGYAGETNDLSQHGAVYMEMGPSGSDFIFDGTPQGEIVWFGDLEQGSAITARFELFIPIYDRDGDATEESGVSLESGFLTVQLLEGDL